MLEFLIIGLVLWLIAIGAILALCRSAQLGDEALRRVPGRRPHGVACEGRGRAGRSTTVTTRFHRARSARG